MGEIRVVNGRAMRLNFPSQWTVEGKRLRVLYVCMGYGGIFAMNLWCRCSLASSHKANSRARLKILKGQRQAERMKLRTCDSKYKGICISVQRKPSLTLHRWVK